MAATNEGLAQTKKAVLFKVVLLGEVGVGKTSLFQRHRINQFKDWPTTLGVDRMEKEYSMHDGSKIKLNIWDTAGSERYRTLTSNYYHGAAACLCIYDLQTEDSLYSLNTWVNDASRFQRETSLFLVGNKFDGNLDHVRVEESTEQAFQEEHEFCASFRISAKTGEGVDACFQKIAEVLYSKSGAGGASARNTGVDLLNPADVKDPQKSDCSC